MTHTISAADLTVSYGDIDAVRQASFVIGGGTICGLLGRNGAGKSTLLSALAAFRRPSSGAVLVDGEDPYENPRLMSEICLIRESGDFDESTRISSVFELCGLLRPTWDGDYAQRLLQRFQLDRRKKVGQLSRGMRSALAVTVGLASRAPVTMFDEPHLGMDAPSRYAFYDELLADYLARPRTIVLSTHLIDEIASLLEDVVILDRGSVLVHSSAEDLRGSGASLTGAVSAVDAVAAGLRVVEERSLGPTKSVTVFGDIDDDRRRLAEQVGVDIGAIALQDLFVHLTSRPELSERAR